MKQFKYKDRHEFYDEAPLFPEFEILESGDEKAEEWFKNHRIKITIGDCTLDLAWNAEIADAIWSVLEDIEGYYEEA